MPPRKTKERQIVPRAPAAVVSVLDSAMTVEQVLKQRETIVQLMSKAMKEGEHYGKIPGCGDKPTLFQPGAQLLAFMFHLRPEYEIKEVDLPGAHKRYRVTCRLYLQGSRPPLPVAEGVGESSSMESRNRFRNKAKETKDTGDVVPKTYWEIFNRDKAEAHKWLAQSYEGKNVGTKKIDGVWKVVEFYGEEGKEENTNPADTFNTVLKIAKKRAFVDATITATASSDFFTQDIEDSPDAFAQARTEKTAKVREVGPEDHSQERAPAGGKFGPNLMKLGERLTEDWLNAEQFMAAARELDHLPKNKMPLEKMPENLAAVCLDNYDAIKEAVEKAAKKS